MDYFKNVKQVFLYLIDDCQLDCVQCLYKADLAFYLKKQKIDCKDALNMIADFREMGASKLTLMGGEPTLYGKEDGCQPLFDIIEHAKELGYEYIRIDTNGQFNSKILENSSFKKLNEITFSLDGPIKEVNDPVRGVGSYDNVVKNIRNALKLGYNINLTSCIHKGMIERDSEGNLYLDRMIRFAEKEGISRINFHDIFKGGIPRDTWSGDISIGVGEWLKVWEEIQNKIDKNEYTIPVRIPQSFATKKEFNSKPSYFGYCSAKLGDRILVHPNGIIRVCSLMIGTPYGVAKFYDGQIKWDHGYTNELGTHEMDMCTPCTNQNKKKLWKGFVPLCVSFKPNQNEFIWNHKLEWEKNNE